jgi:peptidoglycan/LPS O-acetylase OafA/YrhL
MPAASKDGRIDIVEFLRGVAALLVVFFHYANSTIPSIKPNPLAAVFAYGRHGVEMFFVISGFVIYLTLQRLRGAPTLADLRKFLLRRSIRVVVPAWASLALTLVVYYSAYYLYKPLDFGWPAMTGRTAACNVVMVCSLAGGHWINAVFWTLEVELCFYLTYSVLLYLWRGDARKVIASYFIFGVALWMTGSTRTFPRYMLIFLVGVLLADALLRRIEVWTLPLALASLAIVYAQVGIRPVAFSAVAALSIYALYKIRLPGWLLFLGTISFSLYLTHTLAAFFGESVLKRLLPTLHAESGGKVVLLFVYAAFATAWSYAFYRLIEAPVVKRARAIR